MTSKNILKITFFVVFNFMVCEIMAQCCSSKLVASNASGRCVGSDYCTACRNCSACKWCNSGGSCGVCGGGSSRSRSRLSSRQGATSLHYYDPPRSYKNNSSAAGYNNKGNNRSTSHFFSTVHNSNETDFYPIKKTVNTKTLNVRSGPGTQYDIIDKLFKYELVPTYGTSDKWTKVKYYKDDEYYEGYVFSQYLVD